MHTRRSQPLRIRHSLSYLVFTVFFAVSCSNLQARPRIIATTDGEIDDRCSMVRFLMYANEWDIEGIIFCSSKFHWKGNGDDIPAHKWADEVWLDKQIDLYEKVYPVLSAHAGGFPTADELRKKVYTGNVEYVGEMEKVTPGSRRIVDVLLDDKPGPVYLQAWGGTNTIARALKSIQEKHPEQMDKVSQKAVLYIILDQDSTFKDYIQPNWPDLEVLYSRRQFECIAYGWHRAIKPPQKNYFEKKWMEENILHDHGPLCAVYEARNGRFRSEGDSPSFMHQIDVGLRGREHPAYGGWGGRFTGPLKNTNTWPGAQDDGDINKPIWRWAIAFQNDWAARADWCVKPPQETNHPPTVQVAGERDRKAHAGETLMLNVAPSSDPDGDTLSYKWWQYEDADTYDGRVKIIDANKCTVSIRVPEDAQADDTLHIIVEMTDNGTPPLTRYARFIITIQ